MQHAMTLDKIFWYRNQKLRCALVFSCDMGGEALRWLATVLDCIRLVPFLVYVGYKDEKRIVWWQFGGVLNIRARKVVFSGNILTGRKRNVTVFGHFLCSQSWIFVLEIIWNGIVSRRLYCIWTSGLPKQAIIRICCEGRYPYCTG